MSIIDKVNKIKKLLNKKKNNECYDNSSSSIISQESFIAFFEKYKGTRRIILLIVLWINIHIFLLTCYMYKLHTTIDTQWVIFAGYWATILGTFISFYTIARGKEEVSENKLIGEAVGTISKSEIEEEIIEERIDIDGDKMMGDYTNNEYSE